MPTAVAAESVAVRENLKARTLRSADSPSAGRLPAATALTVLKRANDPSGQTWIKLTYRKTTG